MVGLLRSTSKQFYDGLDKLSLQLQSLFMNTNLLMNENVPVSFKASFMMASLWSCTKLLHARRVPGHQRRSQDNMPTIFPAFYVNTNLNTFPVPLNSLATLDMLYNLSVIAEELFINKRKSRYLRDQIQLD